MFNLLYVFETIYLGVSLVSVFSSQGNRSDRVIFQICILVSLNRKEEDSIQGAVESLED